MKFKVSLFVFLFTILISCHTDLELEVDELEEKLIELQYVNSLRI